MRKRFEFLIEGLKRSTSTGSLVPGSRALGRALAQDIPKDRPVRILEAGPGTGPITEAVIEAAALGSFLQLVEVNPVFCKTLRQRYLERPQKIGIQLFEGFLQDLPETEPFDILVSSLPHNNFEVADLRTLFAAYRSLLRPGGFLTFYEYWGVRNLRFVWLPSARRRLWSEIDSFFKKEIDPITRETQIVMSNIPPALVRHVRF